MKVLGLDTATSACSVALVEDGRVIASRFEAMRRGQSERLMPMVLEVMKDAGAEFPDLDLLAVTNGPGAFTGLRIGLAAVRGMALAGKLGCFGVTPLDAVAAGVTSEERENMNLLVFLDSRRADIYAQAFAPDLRPVGEPQSVLPGDLAAFAGHGGGHGKILVAGDAAERGAEVLKAAGMDVRLSTAPGAPHAKTVAALAAERWSPETPPAPPRPLYLRPPDAIVPKNGGQLRP